MVGLLPDEEQSHFWNFFDVGIKFTLLTAFLVLNFSAMATALAVHKSSPKITRMFAGIFAFFFGIIYFINYVGYRVNVLKKPAMFNPDNPFPF